MIKRIGRRFVSLLLTFVTILTMLPAITLPALAKIEGDLFLPDLSIGLRYSGDADNAWTAGGAKIAGSVRSTGGCSTTHYESKLTITNKKSTKATLSFDYAVTTSDGTIQVDGTDVNADGTFSKELESNTSIEVYIKSNSTDADTKITMNNVNLVADVTATVTFQPAKNGRYTVGGKLITEKYPSTQSAAKPYKVEATPNEGYQFLGWYDATNKIYLQGGANSSIFVSPGNSEVTAIFGVIGTNFQVGTSELKWDDLNDAIISTRNNSSGYIKQLESCTILGEYTIPSGVTLLIPFNEDGMLYKATPSPTSSQADAKVFRTLTMAADSSITLENGAAISVGGQYYASSGGSKGKMAGPYGCIKMEDGSTITVQNGASLYAWGFISGNGAVTVESGGSVYEWYQILDFRGGNNSLAMVNKVFPFNQYAVQNIEVPLTVHVGASETAYTAVNALGGIKPTSIPFIGTNGMFQLISGSLTKAYDGATDRMIYTVDGEANLNSLNLKLAGMSVNSSSYVLPLTNNMTVNLTQRSKLTVNQTVALLPGVEVTIARDAELVVPNGQSMYIYDKEQWGNYCGDGSTFIPVVYAPGKTYSRTKEDLVDVKVDVNGTLTANGDIYTTESGANICSSEGGGRYSQQGAPGKETKTYQYDGGTKQHTITITPAKLKNADNNYIETNKTVAKAGDTFTYCKCQECSNGTWVKNLMVAEFNATQYGTLKEAVKEFLKNSSDNTYIKMLHSTTEDINADGNLYLDLNGCTVTGYFTMNGHTLYGMDSTTDGYDGRTAGKIVGGASFYKNIYQTGNVGDDTYKRYVAIQGKEKDTSTLSFHRFNISVTGYRFELAAPQCALFFIGKFQGDDAAKKYLTSLGFTLTDIAGETTNPRYDIPDVEKIPSESNPGESPVVLSSDGAFLFEAYLIREIDKGDSNTYQKQFSATAKATFNNSGVQDEDNSRSSVERKLSFQQALWDALSAPDMEEKDRKILMNFLIDMNIPNPNPNP